MIHATGHDLSLIYKHYVAGCEAMVWFADGFQG